MDRMDLGRALLALVLLAPALAADASALPPALQKIKDYNQGYARDFQAKISFLIAFFAGALTLLSPCVLPLLPAYFSYTFRPGGKTEVTKMTLAFSLGVAVVFMAFGAVAGFVGEQSLLKLQRPELVLVAGLVLMAMGIMTALGKGFSSFIRPRTAPAPGGDGVAGVFVSGTLFALGWTACVGPILSGILSVAALLGNVLYASLLMGAYSLGIFAPLFILSVFYDSTGLAKSPLIRGKEVRVRLFGKDLLLHTTNLVSGAFLALIGLSFVVFRGTSVVNTWDFLHLKQYFYSVQGRALSSSSGPYPKVLGGALLLLVIVLAAHVLRFRGNRGAEQEREKKKKKKKKKKKSKTLGRGTT